MNKSFKLISIIAVVIGVILVTFIFFESQDLVLKGDNHFEEGNFRRAYDYYYKAFSKDELNEELTVKMIDCLSFSGDQMSAKVQFDKYHQQFPNNLEILNRGLYLYDGNATKVITIVEKIITIYESQDNHERVDNYTSYMSKIRAAQQGK